MYNAGLIAVWFDALMAPKATRFSLDSSSSAVYHGAHAERFSSVSSVSLDGYVARSNGAVDFLFIPKDYSTAPSSPPSRLRSWDARVLLAV